MNYILVSVIIPVRNEEKFIAKCLNSLIAQDYPKKQMEILAVDGMSEDETRKVIGNFSAKYPFIKLLDNPKKITPTALNIGIKAAKGKIIMRMDAHARYQKDYVSKCLKYLEKYKADNIGGTMKTFPAKDTLTAKAIAVCLSVFFGVGNSRFRTGSGKVKEVDTVFGGCYRKEVFQKIGFFNERLIRSQDLEFNLRLKKSGGKIILAPEIVSCYYPKSDIKSFFLHNLKDGFWSLYPLKFVKMPFRARHYLPLFFLLILIATLILGFFLSFFFQLFLFIIELYILASLYFSIQISFQKKDVRFLFLMPFVFAVRHFGYGLGSLRGLLKLIL